MTGTWYLDLLVTVLTGVLSWLHGRTTAPKPPTSTPPVTPPVPPVADVK